MCVHLMDLRYVTTSTSQGTSVSREPARSPDAAITPQRPRHCLQGTRYATPLPVAPDRISRPSMQSKGCLWHTPFVPTWPIQMCHQTLQCAAQSRSHEGHPTKLSQSAPDWFAPCFHRQLCMQSAGPVVASSD